MSVEGIDGDGFGAWSFCAYDGRGCTLASNTDLSVGLSAQGSRDEEGRSSGSLDGRITVEHVDDDGRQFSLDTSAGVRIGPDGRASTDAKVDVGYKF